MKEKKKKNGRKHHLHILTIRRIQNQTKLQATRKYKNPVKNIKQERKRKNNERRKIKERIYAHDGKDSKPNKTTNGTKIK